MKSVYEYVLVKCIADGRLFRMPPTMDLPDGYEKVERDDPLKTDGRCTYPVYDDNGRLLPKYWALERLDLYSRRLELQRVLFAQKGVTT